MSTGIGDTNLPDPFAEAAARVAQLLAMTATLIEAVALLKARYGDRRPEQPPQPPVHRPTLNMTVRSGPLVLPAGPSRSQLLAGPTIRVPRPQLPAGPTRRELTARPTPGGSP